MSDIQADSIYPGGEWRRQVDRWLRNYWIERDHPIQRAGHAVEHTGRAIYSAFQGNFDRADAEIKRAGKNFGDVSKYSD